MATEPGQAPKPEGEETRLRIYLLPNLLTAGNLFCGFLALTKIVEADISDASFPSVIRHAIFFIILACVFDLLDGRVARLGGQDSPFGREFDSLADIISFGAAPAFLVHRVVLHDVFLARPEIGWFIASVYLICGAFRLARFNCLAAAGGGGPVGGAQDHLWLHRQGGLQPQTSHRGPQRGGRWRPPGLVPGGGWQRGRCAIRPSATTARRR